MLRSLWRKTSPLARNLGLSLSAATATTAAFSTTVSLASAPPSKTSPALINAADLAAHFPDTARAPDVSFNGFPLEKLQIPTEPSLPTKVILIECGSFSPITNMHLLLFETMRDDLTKLSARWEVVGGIVSPVHDAYGKASLVPAPHRLAMARLATADSPWVAVADWELRQPGWTPTRRVLAAYQAAVDKSGLYAAHGGARVKLVMGADVLESMLVPGLWAEDDMEAILGEFGVVVSERVGADTRRLIASTPLFAKHAEMIHVCEPRVTNDISSTLVRNQLSAGLSTRFLTPDAVADYARAHGLYGAKPAYGNRPVVLSTDAQDSVAGIAAAAAEAGKEASWARESPIAKLVKSNEEKKKGESK